MRSNRELIQKADSILNFGTNGKLAPQQSKQFIEMMAEKSDFLKKIRVVQMNNPQVEINRLGVGSRILHPRVTQGVALDVSKRGTVDTGKITLTSKEVIAELTIDQVTVEDAIERDSLNFINDRFGSPGGIHSHVMRLIAERAALDLLDLAINGDTAIDPATNDLLAINDGFLKLASLHPLAASNAHISPTLIHNATLLMPEKYLADIDNLFYYMSRHTEAKLRAQLANRATVGGDQYLQTKGSMQMSYGSTYALPKMPSTTVLFTYPNNLIFGIQRDIRIEVEKDIRTGMYLFVLTARVDFKAEEPDAMVKITGLNTGALT